MKARLARDRWAAVGLLAALAQFSFASAVAAPQSASLSVSGITYPPVAETQQNQSARALHPTAAMPGIPHIALPVPRARDLRSLASEAPGTPLRIGVHRAVGQVLRGADLQWAEVPSGRVAVISATSPGARALRVELDLDSLPVGAQLRFYAPSRLDRVMGPYGPQLPRESRLPAGPGAPSFWSPVIAGDTLSMEVWVSTSAAALEVRIAVRQVAHLVVNPLAIDGDMRVAAGPSGSCNRNIACDSRYLETASSVAKIVFEVNGSSSECSGQLVANTSGNRRPYFLTAAHCIAQASAARSATFFWFFQRAACKDTGDDVESVQTAGGARLIATTGFEGRISGTDTTLLKLRAEPPDSASFSGWTVDDPLARSGPTRVEGIHHPSGDVKMGSIGQTRRTVAISADSDAEEHFEVVWKKGTTEPGSSGSGIWIGNRWPHQYLIGVLSGGFAACGEAHKEPDFYGRFAAAFSASAQIRRRLDPGGLIAGSLAGQQ